MARVFLTHTPEKLENYYGRRALAELERMAEVRVNATGAVLDTDALLESAAGCEIIVSDRRTPGPADFFDRAADAVAFLRCAVDISNVDVAAASRNGILVTHATPGFAQSVAEMALGHMIDLARGISRSVLAYRTGEVPEVRMGRQLAGSTLGIIGYGEIGRRLADLGRALGMSVLVDDPYETIGSPGLEQVDLEDLLPRSDFVICLAVATPETENLIDAAVFAAMRSSAFFLNLSRGDLVDEAALTAALDAGRIAGAGMDVGRAPDQMPTPALAARPDVIATPHTAGLTPVAVEHQAFDTVGQVRAILAGEMPPHAANPEAASRLSRMSEKPSETSVSRGIPGGGGP